MRMGDGIPIGVVSNAMTTQTCFWMLRLLRRRGGGLVGVNSNLLPPLLSLSLPPPIDAARDRGRPALLRADETPLPGADRVDVNDAVRTFSANVVSILSREGERAARSTAAAGAPLSMSILTFLLWCVSSPASAESAVDACPCVSRCEWCGSWGWGVGEATCLMRSTWVGVVVVVVAAPEWCGVCVCVCVPAVLSSYGSSV